MKVIQELTSTSSKVDEGTKTIERLEKLDIE